MKKKLFDLIREEELAPQNTEELFLALEHQTYKIIPGTKCSYRIDPENTNTKTKKHAHVYAKKDGKGDELYSVNMDGRGHDGSSGIRIPAAHATYFRNKNFLIPDNLTLESLNFSSLSPDDYEFVILDE